MTASQLHTQLDRALSLDDVQSRGIGSRDAHRGGGSHRRSQSEHNDAFAQRRANDVPNNRSNWPQRSPPPRLHMPTPYSSPERNGPRSPQYEGPPNLRRRIGELQTELDETREALAIEHRVAVKREMELSELAAENNCLRENQPGFEAAKAFSTSESEPDSQPLIKAFETLNLGVLELALQVSKELHPDYLAVRLHPSNVETFLRRNVKGQVYLRTILTRSAAGGVAIRDVIVPLCQCIVHSFLAEFIFWPFFPGLVGSQNEFFYKLRDRIYSQQSQEKAARWRSITYQAAASDRNNEALATHITKEFFAILEDVLRSLLPQGKFVADDLFPKLAPRAAALVVTAMVWQDTARMQYTSHDYDVFFPLSGAAILDEEMEIVQLSAAAGKAIGIRTGQAAQTVLLPLSLGLRATRSESAMPGDEKNCRTISKAKVLVI
ncbi:hypothetical protein AURDEDRAFT_150532 [Auricularia subglabra TFB-10046 SS5]|nr:hypothetical protein AURDEDRAFT_150532 [Auricularia subglabra TFB-10046 SS5]